MNSVLIDAQMMNNAKEICECGNSEFNIIEKLFNIYWICTKCNKKHNMWW